MLSCYIKERTEGGTAVHLIKLAAGQVLYDSRNTHAQGLYRHGEYPFVAWIYDRIPGTPWGFGCFDYLAPVQEYIDTQRPVGAGVTVQAPGETTVNLKITAQLSGTTAEAVEAAMVSELDTYLKFLIETAYTAVYYSAEENPSITISRNRLAALLLGIDGVQDFSALTINGTTSNLAVGKDDVPAVGTVEVTAS